MFPQVVGLWVPSPTTAWEVAPELPRRRVYTQDQRQYLSTGTMTRPFPHPPEEVFSPSPHPHLLVDLLVDTSSTMLQLTALGLGARITTLERRVGGGIDCG